MKVRYLILFRKPRLLSHAVSIVDVGCIYEKGEYIDLDELKIQVYFCLVYDLIQFYLK